MTRVRDAVLDALRRGMDQESLDDFLAGVDWTGYAQADASVRATLGRLEQWTTMYREGDLNVQQYAENLLSVLKRSGSLSA